VERFAKATDEKFAGLAQRNRQSIDGLPALDPDHPLPRPASSAEREAACTLGAERERSFTLGPRTRSRA